MTTRDVYLDHVARIRRQEQMLAATPGVTIWQGAVPTVEDLERAAADRRVFLAGPPMEVWPSPLARWHHVKAKAAAVWAALP